MAVELLEAGFYELEREGAAAEVVAVNVDTAESDLAAVDPEELQGALTRVGAAPAAAGVAHSLTPQDAERRQSLWWYLLAAAFLLLLAETALSNRMSASTTAG
jgi:hypothetical protein